MGDYPEFEYFGEDVRRFEILDVIDDALICSNHDIPIRVGVRVRVRVRVRITRVRVTGGRVRGRVTHLAWMFPLTASESSSN